MKNVYVNPAQAVRGMMEGKMSEVKLKCTLTDNELVDKSKELVSKLCETGGHSWCLRVPVDLNNDPDIIFTELGNRVLSLRAQLSEAQEEIERLKNYADKLATGFPEGMLPKDIELLKESNAAMASDIESMGRIHRADMENMFQRFTISTNEAIKQAERAEKAEQTIKELQEKLSEK